MKAILLTSFALLLCCIGYSQTSITGNYKQVDEETGEVESIIQLRLENGKLYGKITKIFPKPGESPNPVCEKCEGEQKNKPIVGMDIIFGMTQDDDVWVKDDGILDPKTGNLYDAKIWLEDGKLKVRGYLGFFYRTQTWLKMEG